MSDEEIISLLQQKEYSGLENLIDVYGYSIITTIRAILNQSIERNHLKDVENEVFYKIWTNAQRFDPTKSSLKTWLLTITKHCSIDKKREIVRTSRIQPVERLPEQAKTFNPFEKEHFLDLVSSLNPEDQLIFLKYYYYQESPEEIAQEFHLTKETIYARLSRGRKKIKQTIGGENT
ncbi:RNA polymerase subunit sigma-70 [Enterococcus sp. JM4C]|uniref:sigma-70 family RNA polymerase sigma factor n=1 Tax=Candidatus Enterococcus huntleyi TaxID=1857217 RepID=UPI001379AB54|nr:sigma-70 family RNA polymerase sigma factor [Enterococcus sp. JM4C]KAF1296896.1 RNA polymerase subunit sigma-70 [Enterococcus sp. JM4C]